VAKGKTLRDLDLVDRKILSILQSDGRIPNADLATRISLSATPTLERVRRLEREGFIEGYVAILNPEKMDAAMTAFVEVNLDRTNEDVLETFARAAFATPEIVECNMIAGGFDYLLKIRVENMTAYRKFMGTRLAELPGIRATHTFMVMENVKNSPAFPVDLPVRPEPPQRKPK
jgi:Lrp/AsnC family transcriptional regulator, leucine-responsive regulatory protein